MVGKTVKINGVKVEITDDGIEPSPKELEQIHKLTFKILYLPIDIDKELVFKNLQDIGFHVISQNDIVN